MLNRIRLFASRGVSRVGAIAMFILMLPIAVAALIIMMFAGVLAMVNLRQRLRDARVHGSWQSTEKVHAGVADVKLRQPIEGSYTVVRD